MTIVTDKGTIGPLSQDVGAEAGFHELVIPLSSQVNARGVKEVYFKIDNMDTFVSSSVDKTNFLEKAYISYRVIGKGVS